MESARASEATSHFSPLTANSAHLRRRLRHSRRRRRRPFGKKRSDEGFVEGVTGFEIFQRIGLRFSKNARPNEAEDHLTEVFAAADAPRFENRRDHGAELFQGVLADTFEELLASDVAAAFAGLFAQLEGVIQRVAQKLVSLAIVTGVLSHDGFDRLGKIKFRHT